MNNSYRRMALAALMIALLTLCGASALASNVTAKTVKATSLRLNHTSVTRYATGVYDDPLNTYRAFKLTPRISPTKATANTDASLIEYVSSNPGVAEVDAQGNVLAVKAGSTKITVRLLDGSKRSATCKVTVKALPALTIALSETSGNLQPGGTAQISATVGPETIANKTACYTSSNKKVATVSSTGLVKAIAPGTAKITVYAKTRTSVKATYTVKVDYKYRLFAISNGSYKYSNVRNREYDLRLSNYRPDMVGMNNMYKAARFDGGAVKVSYRLNQTGAGMRSYLKAIANYKEIGSDDVTIIYYSGHGADSGFGADYNGALVGVDFDPYKVKPGSMVTIKDLTSYLSRIPGQVIVILDSCYSGEFIQAKSTTNQRLLQTAQMKLINNEVVSAFQSASAGTQAGAVTAKDLTPSGSAQFHVITGCSNNQLSYTFEGSTADGLWARNTFRSLLTYAIEEGTSGAGGSPLRADTNGDKKVSLSELYLYAKPRVQYFLNKVKTEKIIQDVQMWPSDDSFAVFAMD